MINHIRTLLFNQAAANTSGLSSELTEYIPDSFTEIKLPDTLQKVYNILFPQGYTTFQKQFTLFTYLQILHTPELLPYLLKFDERYVYDLDKKAYARTVDTSLRISEWKNSTCDIQLQHGLFEFNQPDIITMSGPYIWTIERDFSAGNTIIIDLNGKAESRKLNISAPSTRTKNIFLLPNYFYIYFILPSFTVTGTFKYIIELSLPIPVNLKKLLSKLQHTLLQTGVREAIFAPWNDYQTDLALLRQIYSQSPESTLKFGAVTLALAYQMEKLRRGLPLFGFTSSVRSIN